MNIIFIEPHLKTCGGIRRIIETANWLTTFGHNVKIFSPAGNPCSWLPSVVPVFKLSTLHKHTSDIVIFNLAEQYELALQAQAKKRVFWVLAPEALYKDPVIPIKALQQDFYFISNSKFTVDYIKKHRNVSYEIQIIPGGINPDHFRHDPTIPKTHHILYYGSSRPWKGTAIIEASFGYDDVKARKMEGLNTPQQQMYTLYNSADVFVSACQAEGFNMPILEAMACGTPVICTDDGGNRDFVVPNVNALVAKRSPQDIFCKVKQVLDSKSLQRTLKLSGLKTVMDPQYKWENGVKKLEKILLGLL